MGKVKKLKKCTNIKCGYEWKPKKKNPKCCPKCRRYLKGKKELNIRKH